MRSYAMKLTVAGIAAAVSLSLTSCGPDNGGAAAGAPAAGAPAGAADGQTPAPTGGAAAPTGTAAPSAAGGAATGGAASGGAGATGGSGADGAIPQAPTAVKFGQPATVDYADKESKTSTKLQITVTGIAPGSIKDFQDAKLNTTGLDGRTLAYVSFTIKNVGDASLSFTAPDSKFVVFDTTGKKGVFANPVASTPLPKCTEPTFHGVTKGMEVKGCTIVSFSGTTSVASVVGYTDVTDLLKLQASWTK